MASKAMIDRIVSMCDMISKRMDEAESKRAIADAEEELERAKERVDSLRAEKSAPEQIHQRPDAKRSLF